MQIETNLCYNENNDTFDYYVLFDFKNLTNS